jgi:hypothetical protein
LICDDFPALALVVRRRVEENNYHFL